MPFFDKILQKIRKKYFYRYQNRNFNINILKVGNRILIQTIRAPTLRRGEGVAETSEAKPEWWLTFFIHRPGMPIALGARKNISGHSVYVVVFDNSSSYQ